MFRSSQHGLPDVLPAPGAYFPLGCDGLAMAAPPPLPASAWTRDTATARSLPDALRCGYTSKRCENPRTVKKSGGLHRFCAYHRERANKNQWRVDNRRRLLRKLGQRDSKAASDFGSPRSTTSDTVDETDACDDDPDSAKNDDANENSMLALADPAGSPNTLSDQDTKILNAMLFSDEDEPRSVDAVSIASVESAETTKSPLLVSHDALSEASVSMDANWNCICSQCLAWSTVLFYTDAMEAARSARVQKYARV